MMKDPRPGRLSKAEETILDLCYDNERLRAALHALVYQDSRNGQWRTAHHGESDVTDIVGAVLSAPKGEDASNNRFYRTKSDQDNEQHYLGAILVRLRAYHELVEAPNIREQVSDEIDWLEERLGVAE